MDSPRGTPRLILELLQGGARQAQDVAAELGIDTSAARRHLENLSAQGLVSASEVIEGPGRPKKMFTLTAEGRETFPRDYPLLLRLVLGQVEENDGRASVERLMAQMAKSVASSVEGESRAKRIASLVALYQRLGFEASAEKDEGGVTIVQRNCPFLKTARDDPELLCVRFDEAVQRAALPGARVELASSLATGATTCVHRIRFARE